MSCALALLLLPLAPVAPSEWTVDDDGPADFAEITDAIASPLVADGDVLLVADGFYESFTLGRELHLVAPAGETFRALSVTVDGAEAVTLAGVFTRDLVLRNVSGCAAIDDSLIGWWTLEPDLFLLVWQGGMRVESCAQVVVQDTTIHGSESCYTGDFSTTEPAVTAVGSTLAFVDCLLLGGIDDICTGGHPVDGAEPALDLTDCVALLAGTRARGGTGWAPAPGAWIEGSELVVRGSPEQDVRGGFHPDGYGDAIAGTDSVARISGVRFAPADLPDWVEVLAVPDPWIRAVDADPLDGVVSVEVFAPAGHSGVLVWGDEPDLVPLADPLDPLWFLRSSILGRRGVVAQSTLAPTTELFPSDGPGGVGAVRVFQAYLRPPSGGPAFLSNPAVVVERW